MSANTTREKSRDRRYQIPEERSKEKIVADPQTTSVCLASPLAKARPIAVFVALFTIRHRPSIFVSFSPSLASYHPSTFNSFSLFLSLFPPPSSFFLSSLCLFYFLFRSSLYPLFHLSLVSKARFLSSIVQGGRRTVLRTIKRDRQIDKRKRIDRQT